jgi:hypothetical protein
LCRRESAAAAAALDRFSQDASRHEEAPGLADRNAAAVLASRRNLANALYERGEDAGRTTVDTLRSWCQQQTFSTAWRLLRR